MENIKMIIRNNLIKNFPETTEDVNHYNRMSGPYISKFKVWYTRPILVQFIYDSIEIPKELIRSNHVLDLYIYVMFINTQPMLTNIDRYIKYVFLVPLDNRTAEELYRGLDNTLMHYNRLGFFMKLILIYGVF